MTENITYRKSDNRDLIINYLRENPVRYEKLRKQARQWEENGVMRYQTFRRWFLKLRDRGIIIHPPCYLVKEYIEANRFEVATLIQDNFGETSTVLLHGRLYQLLGISKTHKIAQIPGVMFALKKGLENDILINNNEIFDILVQIITNIVLIERDYPMETSKRIITEVETEFISVLNNIIKRKRKFPSGFQLELLSISGNLDTVNIIFEKIPFYKNFSSEERTQANLGYFLGPATNIHSKYFSSINKHLDDLAENLNPEIQKVSLELRRSISQGYPYRPQEPR